MIEYNIQKIIDKYGLHPKKSLGQNFLFDQNITDRIVKSAFPLSEIVVEIGPGPGCLTRSLLLESNIKKVIAIEQDDRCVLALKELKDIYPDKLVIIHGDALNFLYDSILDKNIDNYLEEQQFSIVANLPYNIGTVLLFKWFNHLDKINNITIMLQKEVVDRIIAIPRTKSYSRISIMSQWLCDVNWKFDVDPSSFFPSPKVTSSIVQLIPRKNKIEVDYKKMELICKLLFNQRRKMIKANLGKIIENSELILDKLGIKGTSRAEELTIENFCQLAKEMT